MTSMKIHSLYLGFFRFLEEMAEEDPWPSYQRLYLEPHEEFLTAYWQSFDHFPREQIVERVRLLHKHALLVARAVAAGESPPKRLHPGARDRVLKLLRDAGVIEREARGRWRVIDPLVRHYLVALDPLA